MTERPALNRLNLPARWADASRYREFANVANDVLQAEPFGITDEELRRSIIAATFERFPWESANVMRTPGGDVRVACRRHLEDVRSTDEALFKESVSASEAEDIVAKSRIVLDKLTRQLSSPSATTRRFSSYVLRQLAQMHVSGVDPEPPTDKPRGLSRFWSPAA